MTEPRAQHEMADPAAAAVGVFIVDDHPGYRNVASAVVTATPGFVVVGAAGSTEETLVALRDGQSAVDLVLMDVNLGEESGTELTRAVTTLRPGVRVVLVSVLKRDELPVDAESCGAVGYLPKGELSPASLEGVLAGQYDW